MCRDRDREVRARAALRARASPASRCRRIDVVAAAVESSCQGDGSQDLAQRRVRRHAAHAARPGRPDRPQGRDAEEVRRSRARQRTSRFAVGPAGTGKDPTSPMAGWRVRAPARQARAPHHPDAAPRSRAGEVARLLARHTLEEKIDPYLRPFVRRSSTTWLEARSADPDDVRQHDRGPPRWHSSAGRTLNESFIVLDEAPEHHRRVR